MARLSYAAVAALLVLAAPSAAFAHMGIIHTGCPTGQAFTQGEITVTGAFVRATPPNAASAGGYLVITNHGNTADTFTGASSEAAKTIDIHQMKMNGNVMEMSAVEGGLSVPAGGSVTLDPHGYHLMMTGLPQPFKQGQCVQMTLHFAQAGDLPIELNIGGFAQQAAPTDGDQPAAPASSSSSMQMDHDMGSMSSMQGM